MGTPIQIPQPPEAKRPELWPGFLKKGMRLSQFRPGQFWIIKHPKRVVHILQESTVELRDEKGMMRVQPCLVVRGMIPTSPIPEHVSAEDVEANRLILAGVETEYAVTHQGPAGSWKEIWAEVQYPAVVKHPKFPAPEVQDGENAPRYPFATVVHVEGREQKREDTSPIRNSRPVGVLLNPEQATAAGRGEQEDAKETPRQEADEEGASPVEARPPEGGASGSDGGSQEGQGLPRLPETVKGLRKFAKDHGVNVTDIAGKGAKAKILARLSMAPTGTGAA